MRAIRAIHAGERLMQTDWVLIARLARELEERLRGRRVEDAGLLPDGRAALIFRRGSERCVLAIDLFSSPPLVTLEDGELGILEEPGFARTLARSLKGMTLAGVASRRSDRLLRFRFSARSRFGVGEELDLYLELVPRFGNIVLVKGESVVAARKEFRRRRIRAADCTGLTVRPAAAARRSRVRSTMPPEGSVLELFAGARAEQTRHAREGARPSATRRIIASIERARAQAARRASRRFPTSGGQRNGARICAPKVRAFSQRFTRSQMRSARPRKSAPPQLFAEYKKLGSSLPHIADRERTVLGALQIVDTLRWEAQRAGSDDIEDVETAVDELQAPARCDSSGDAQAKTAFARAAYFSRLAHRRRALAGGECGADVSRRAARRFMVSRARGSGRARNSLARRSRASPRRRLAGGGIACRLLFEGAGRRVGRRRLYVAQART